MTPTTIDLTGLPEPVVREVTRLVQEARRKQTEEAEPSPRDTGGERPPLRGRLADLGLSISKEEIDDAQREMWANFPREFPDVPKR